VGSSAWAQGALILFLLGWGGGGEKFFFIFPHSQNILIRCPMGFHHVPNLFPMFFAIFSTHSQCHLFLHHMLWQMLFSSQLYGWAKGGLLHVYSLGDNKSFVSNHSHFKVEWIFKKLIVQTFDLKNDFFPIEPINQFITK
jgi:hypothetical protein